MQARRGRLISRRWRERRVSYRFQQLCDGLRQKNHHTRALDRGKSLSKRVIARNRLAPFNDQM
jgi:hypothetical protein